MPLYHARYTHSAGLPAARAAIASAFTSEAAPVTADDVIIASGGSGAIDIALSALVDAGTNVLVPRPGFPLYGTIAAGYGGEVRYFDLLVGSGGVPWPHRDPWRVRRCVDFPFTFIASIFCHHLCPHPHLPSPSVDGRLTWTRSRL